MKKYIVLCLLFLYLALQGQDRAQHSERNPGHLRFGAGYYGENLLHPGLVLEFEYDLSDSPVFSLPLRSTIGYHFNEDYNALFLDLQKGFRKSFPAGFFLEQGIGAGIIAKSYRTEMWYLDSYYNSVPHGGKPVFGFMPSVYFGAGFDLSREKNGSALLWVRPKIYWDLGFRGLHQPYFALQLGYSQTIKTR